MNTRAPEKEIPVPSKARWFLLAPLILLILGSLGAVIWWQHYQTTPGYSLALIIDAARRDDKVTFDKLVDTDQVVENFLSGLEQTAGSGSSADLLGALRRKLQEVAPPKSESARARIREGVRQRINEVGQTAGEAPFAIMAVGLYFKTEITTNGDKATILANHQNQKLELGLTRTGDYWRVTSARDDALAAQVMADILKDVPKGLSPIDLANPLKGTLPKLPIP